MAATVAGYHADRGIQIESLWGNLLLVADRLGYDAMVREAFGSYDITTGITATVKTLSTVLSLLVIGLVWVARRSRRQGDPRYLAATFFATLARCSSAGESVTAVPHLARGPCRGGRGRPCGGASKHGAPSHRHPADPCRVPLQFFDLLAGEPVSLAVLTARNLCLMTLAFCAVRAWLTMSGAQSAGGSHKREPPVAMARSPAENA
jgi:hypothetical protein